MNCNHTERNKSAYGFQFNPFELTICGVSDAVRASLAAKIVSLYHFKREVGQVIGKPADAQDESAARMGINLIRSKGQHGLLYPEPLDAYLRPRPLLDADLVIIESDEDTDGPKLVCVGDGVPDPYSNVLAYVGAPSACPVLPASANYFTDDQILELGRFLDDHFAAIIEARPVHGLVLTGGKSTRMQADKAALNYHGKSQVAHCHDLLAPYCDQVFVSLRREQQDDHLYAGFATIPDAFLGFGPLGGILSAQKAHPEAAWLVLACDLPFVSPGVLDQLVSERNPFKLATAFISSSDGLPEPLCAIYEPKSIFRLLHFLALGYHCPRKVLINSDTCLLESRDSRALDNANSPDERDQARRFLAQSSGDSI